MNALSVLAVLFLSGAAALIYQVLWMRQLALVFGATAYAAATTLSIFFLGLALGSYFWGERSAGVRRPLIGYAWLELGIAVSALAFFGLTDAIRFVDATVLALVGEASWLSLSGKVLVATVILLPPAVFMGGTLPMLGEHLIRDRDRLGQIGALLYAVNTAGGALGALAAGFYLPAAFGVRSSYLIAVALSLAVAAAAWLLGRNDTERELAADRHSSLRPAAPPTSAAPAANLSLPIAFFSGFAALALEVLWTRMFAQVLHNSVYSFAAILVTFLIALGLGAVVASRLSRLAAAPERVLFYLLAAAGLAVALTPWWFHFLTDGLAYIAPQASWGAYLGAVFGRAALALLVPGILVGTIFPFLLRLARLVGDSPGRTIGRLAATNTLGAILGSMLAGFVLLPALGLWGSINAIGLLYLAGAVLLAPAEAGTRLALRAAPLAALLLFATAFDSSRLALVRLDSARNETLVESWESAYGVTAVVRRTDSLRIKLDNYYSLGGTAALAYEQTQADVPLVLHRDPKSVFFLGLGTGITAGAAMLHAVDRVVVAELVPEVIVAAEKHFAPYINGLFDDPRAHVVAADGRSLLRARSERYDVIVADLFIPWQAGAGSLYTREHFTVVRDRLAPGGLFAQWLPLYQLSRNETMIIARTMLDVFPYVTVWRGDFLPDRPIVALIASVEAAPLDPDAVVANFRRRRQSPEMPRAAALAMTGLFYGGNLSANRDRFDGFALNTDDRPVIEFSAPLTHRSQHDPGARWFTGEALSAWYQDLAAHVPSDSDPFLERLAPAERAFAGAGTDLYASRTAATAGDAAKAKRFADRFARRVPPEIAGMFGDPEAEPDP